MSEQFINGTMVPQYVKDQLENNSQNVLVGYDVIKQYGKEKLLSILKNEGLDVQLHIVFYSDSETEYPRDATYILERVG